MTENRFHNMRNAKRRGENLPARLRVSARRGVTLVELMISMMILAIVCIAWLEIIGVQSARREARRREAVDRLSGVMDAFMYCYKGGSLSQNTSYYMAPIDGGVVTFNSEDDLETAHPLFDSDVSPIGYQLCVVKFPDIPESGRFSGWGTSQSWLVGRLYDTNGKLGSSDRPFFTLSVCLGL